MSLISLSLVKGETDNSGERLLIVGANSQVVEYHHFGLVLGLNRQTIYLSLDIVSLYCPGFLNALYL